MGVYKKNETLTANYVALNKTAYLVDVTMRVYNPSDSLVSTVVMTEVIAESGMAVLGLYRAPFIPNVDGQWRIRITSAVNGDDISKVFEIGNYKLDDIKDQTQDIEDKIDILDNNVDTINTNVSEIKIKTDNLPVDTASEISTIQSKLDDIAASVNFGGYILN